MQHETFEKQKLSFALESGIQVIDLTLERLDSQFLEYRGKAIFPDNVPVTKEQFVKQFVPAVIESKKISSDLVSTGLVRLDGEGKVIKSSVQMTVDLPKGNKGEVTDDVVVRLGSVETLGSIQALEGATAELYPSEQ